MNYNILNFTMFCISNVAMALGRSLREVYRSMRDGNIIDGYIVPCYDVLHTFSKEYILEDIISLMQKKGVGV